MIWVISHSLEPGSHDSEGCQCWFLLSAVRQNFLHPTLLAPGGSLAIIGISWRIGLCLHFTWHPTCVGFCLQNSSYQVTSHIGLGTLLILCVCVCVCVCACAVTQSYLIFGNAMDCSPRGSSVHGNFPGKNTGVGCYFLLQGSNPGIEPASLQSPALASRFFATAPPGKPSSCSSMTHFN